MSEETKTDAKKVKFAEVGSTGGVVEIELGPDEGLKELLAKRSVSSDRQVRVNNVVASQSTELKDGDLVMALPRVVGGKG